MFAWTRALAVAGVSCELFAVPATASTWTCLVLAWVTVTPLWAVSTAWLVRDAPPPRAAHAAAVRPRARPAPRSPPRLARRDVPVRAPRCSPRSSGRTVDVDPARVATWGVALAGDAAADGVTLRALVDVRSRSCEPAPRARDVPEFHYVCLAWVFFRATSFENALAILRQLAPRRDRPREPRADRDVRARGRLPVSLLRRRQLPLAARAVRALPPWAQGALLAAAALVLRELAHTKIVPFIYFQF